MIFFKGKIWKIAVMFFIWILFLVSVNKLSSFFLFDRTSYEVPSGLEIGIRHTILPWLNFDGRKYLDIATRGYLAMDTIDLHIFFPVYPLTIKVLSNIFHLNPVISGLVISITSIALAMLIFYKLLTNEYGQKTSEKIIMLMFAFPTSFYFLAFYTESLFFLLVVLCFWFLQKKNLFLASVFAGTASATRIVGLALMPVIAYEAYKYYKSSGRINISIILSPLGFVVYSLYNWITTGNALLMVSGQRLLDRNVGLLSPINAFKESLLNVLSGPKVSYDSPFVYPVIVAEFITVIFLAIVIYLSYRKIPLKYWLYSFFSFLFISFGDIVTGVPRYALVIFPIFIFLAQDLSKRAYYIYFFISLFMLTVLTSIFLRGYWVA